MAAAKGRLPFRVEEHEDVAFSTPSVVARFHLAFDVLEYLGMLAKYGSKDSVYVAYQNGREFKRASRANGVY